MSHLIDEQIDLQLQRLKDWKKEGNAIVRTYTFDNFVEAISFMTEVAFHAQELQHYPEWKNIYDTVYVRLITYDINGLTGDDFLLAKRMEKVFQTRTGVQP